MSKNNVLTTFIVLKPSKRMHDHFLPHYLIKHKFIMIPIKACRLSCREIYL